MADQKGDPPNGNEKDKPAPEIKLTFISNNSEIPARELELARQRAAAAAAAEAKRKEASEAALLESRARDDQRRREQRIFGFRQRRARARATFRNAPRAPYARRVFALDPERPEFVPQAQQQQEAGSSNALNPEAPAFQAPEAIYAFPSTMTPNYGPVPPPPGLPFPPPPPGLPLPPSTASFFPPGLPLHSQGPVGFAPPPPPESGARQFAHRSAFSAYDQSLPPPSQDELALIAVMVAGEQRGWGHAEIEVEMERQANLPPGSRDAIAPYGRCTECGERRRSVLQGCAFECERHARREKREGERERRRVLGLGAIGEEVERMEEVEKEGGDGKRERKESDGKGKGKGKEKEGQ